MTITLLCAVVGAAEAIVCVEIDASASVVELKVAIKGKAPNTINCEADKLKLYLAKQPDGSWLNEDDVERLTGIDLSTSFVKMKASRALDHRTFGFVPDDDRHGGASIRVLVETPMYAVQIAEAEAEANRTAALALKASSIPQQRKERWDILNLIPVQAITKADWTKEKRSVARSLVYGRLVRNAYRPFMAKYEQPVREVPQETLTRILSVLRMKKEGFGTVRVECDAQRRYLIEPLFTHVVHLFHAEHPPMKIFMEEELIGDYVRPIGYFDFMLARGEKRVCLTHAKNEDFDQGIAQTIVAMEVASDLGTLSVAHGIVTNYAQWIFLERSDDFVKESLDTLSFELGYATDESLTRIAGKIYSLLSN